MSLDKLCLSDLHITPLIIRSVSTICAARIALPCSLLNSSFNPENSLLWYGVIRWGSKGYPGSPTTYSLHAIWKLDLYTQQFSVLTELIEVRSLEDHVLVHSPRPPGDYVQETHLGVNYGLQDHAMGRCWDLLWASSLQCK